MSNELDWVLGLRGAKGFDPEKHRKRVAAYRAKRRGSGVCISCGQPKTDNLLQCEGCRDKGKQTITRRRYERSAAGLCYECGENPSTGKGTRCVGCAEKVAEVARNIRRMKRERLESTPGGGSPRVSPKDRPSTRPRTRTERHHDFVARMASQGKCPECKQPNLTEHPTCLGCRKRRNVEEAKRKAKLRAEGTCPDCGLNPSSPKHRSGLCVNCLGKGSNRSRTYRSRVGREKAESRNVQAFYEEQARLRGQGGQQE